MLEMERETNEFGFLQDTRESVCVGVWVLTAHRWTACCAVVHAAQWRMLCSGGRLRVPTIGTTRRMTRPRRLPAVQCSGRMRMRPPSTSSRLWRCCTALLRGWQSHCRW